MANGSYLLIIFAKNWSSHQKCFIKIADLKNFSKFNGKYLWSLSFNKVANTAYNVIKKENSTQVFRVSFVKFLKTPYLQNKFVRLNLKKVPFFNKLGEFRGVLYKRCSYKNRNIHRKIPVPESTESCSFIKKETLAQVFSCVLCEISMNTFFYGTLPVAASRFMSWLDIIYFFPFFWYIVLDIFLLHWCL